MQYPSIFGTTVNEIDLNDLLGQITLDSTGAAAIFTGMVRGITTGAVLTRLTIAYTKPISPWLKQK